MTTYESYYVNKEHSSPDEWQEDLNVMMECEFFNLKKDIEMVDNFVKKVLNKMVD